MRMDDEEEVKRGLLQQLIEEMTKGQQHDIQMKTGHSVAPMKMEQKWGEEVHDMAKPVSEGNQGYPEPDHLTRMDSPTLKDAMAEQTKHSDEHGTDPRQGAKIKPSQGDVDPNDENQKKSTKGPMGQKFKLRRSF